MTVWRREIDGPKSDDVQQKSATLFDLGLFHRHANLVCPLGLGIPDHSHSTHPPPPFYQPKCLPRVMLKQP
jgi:hypothetical protein